MANICSFSMKVVGDHKNIESFYKALTQEGKIYMGRGADADIDYEDGHAMIYGSCKWSIISALIDNAIDMRTNPKGWYWGEDTDPSTLEFVTLYEACAKWQLDMEVYSEECGCQFQEHFICRKGEVKLQECIDWEEYDVYDYETKEEAEEDLEVEFTNEEWANRDANDGRICRGGYECWDFEI
jgi:hypothetical protein